MHHVVTPQSGACDERHRKATRFGLCISSTATLNNDPIYPRVLSAQDIVQQATWRRLHGASMLPGLYAEHTYQKSLTTLGCWTRGPALSI